MSKKSYDALICTITIVWALAATCGLFWGAAAIAYKLLSIGGSEMCYKYLQLPVPPIAP